MKNQIELKSIKLVSHQPLSTVSITDNKIYKRFILGSMRVHHL